MATPPRPHPGPTPAGLGDLLDDVFPWLVIAFAAVIGVVFTGAWVAAAVGGGSPQAIGLDDTGVALARLPGRLSHPADAWPAPARGELPGALLYWASQAVVTALAGAAGALLWALWRRRRRAQPMRRVLGVAAEAGFGGRGDLGPLAVRRPVPGRVTLGRAWGRLVACESQTSLAVVGPTGCGKTAGFAIPALLEWQGPVLATSVKDDLLDATIQHRRRQGAAWVYDPSRSSSHPGSQWSPLAACGTWVGAMRMAAWMVEATQPRVPDSVNDADYWYTQARKALAPHLYAAACEGRSIADLLRWVDSREQAELEAALARAAAARAGDDGLARREALWQAALEVAPEVLASGPRRKLLDRPPEQWPAQVLAEIARAVDAEWQSELAIRLGDNPLAPLVALQALWCRDVRLRDSVYTTLENVLAAWADPGVSAAARGGDIDLEAWLRGNHTLYVVGASHEQRRLRPVLTVFLQQAIRAAYEAAAANGGRLAQPCLVLLDEAGNIAPLPDLPSYVSTARSHNITFVTVWQDLAQIRATYRDRAQTVLNNHRAKLFGTGISDPDTLEVVSRLIGDEQRTDHTVSAELAGGRRRTLAEHHGYRRAAPLDVLRRLRPNEAVLLYGSELPVPVRLRPWFADPALRAIAQRPDLTPPQRPQRSWRHGFRRR